MRITRQKGRHIARLGNQPPVIAGDWLQAYSGALTMCDTPIPDAAHQRRLEFCITWIVYEGGKA